MHRKVRNGSGFHPGQVVGAVFVGVEETQMAEDLSWRLCLAGFGYRASGHSGLYVVIYHRDNRGGDGCWNAEHQRGRGVRQLGVVATLEQAKALAQCDHDRGNGP